MTRCWHRSLKSCENMSLIVRHVFRVLTTSARKPPLRTDKFAALLENCCASASDPKIKLRRIWLLRTHSSPKRPHEQQRIGSTGRNGVVKKAKAQSLPQNAPILTEVFGPMWLTQRPAEQGGLEMYWVFLRVGRLPIMVSSGIAPSPSCFGRGIADKKRADVAIS
jgi:hypothetical protein